MKIFNKTVTINELIPYTILAVYTLVLAFLMVYWGNWTIGDDAIYLRTTALGKFNWCLDGLLPKDGRLFPLAHFDYNLTLLLPFLPVIKAHYLLNALSFCLYVYLLFRVIRSVVYSIAIEPIDGNIRRIYIPIVIFFVLILFVFSKKMLLIALLLYLILYCCSRWIKNVDYRPWIVVLSIFSILLQPMWSADFFEIHTATRLFVVLAILFIYSVYRFLGNQKWSYAILAVFAAFYLTYSYEYHFGLFVVFATSMLLFYPNQTKMFKGLMWSILGVALSYVVVYMIFIFPNIEQAYTHEKQSMAIGSQHLLSWVRVYGFAIALGLYRLYAVLWKKDREHIFYDSCLAAGLAGMGALIVLGMFDPYCHMTNIILCYIPVIYWVQKYFGSKSSVILYGLLIYTLVPPFMKSVHNRVDSMQETMPKVEQVMELIDHNTKMVMIMPDNPKEMVSDFSREEGCQMFISRFESIIRYADADHYVYHIDECTIEDVSQLREDVVYMTNPEWIDNKEIIDALAQRENIITFGTTSIYFNN